MAGKQGLEPRYYDPESYVLPLDDFPAQVQIIPDFNISVKILNPAINYRRVIFADELFCDILDSS